MSLVSEHINLISLVGVCTRGEPILLLISYAMNGSLLSFLKHRATSDRNMLSQVKRAHFAADIAAGMAHLVEHHIVHRDLAARNILVCGEESCKIADFGLSRGIAASDQEGADDSEYYKASTGQ